MQTWRTGTIEPSLRHSDGFSLIEVLVVLVIVGVMTTVVSLSIRGSGERAVENAAQRARALIQLACERAVLSGRDIGFSPVLEGLRFGYFGVEGWQPMAEGGNDELRARALGSGLQLSASRDGVELPLADEPGRDPAFACLSSGELTPFVLRLARDDAELTWELEGQLDGELQLRQLDHDF